MLKSVKDTFQIDDFRWAVEHAYWNTARTLLGGANEQDSSLLDIAVSQHLPEAVSLLLEHGADVNELHHRMTPLDDALTTGDNDTARILMAYGGKASPFALAFTCSDFPPDHYMPIVRKMLEAGLISQTIEDNFIKALVKRNKHDVLAELLEHDYIMHLTNEHLLNASHLNYLETVQLLLNQCVDPNIEDSTGVTPITESFRHKNKEMEQLLRNAGAIRPANVDTDLHKAIIWEEEVTVRQLIENGANIEERNVNGRTPLMQAIAHLPQIVPYLVESGADIHTRIPAEASLDPDADALAIAITYGQTDIVKLLIEKGADVNTIYKASSPDHNRGRLNESYRYSYLIFQGVENDNIYPATPLYYAILNGCTDIVKLLLENGVDIEYRTMCGRSSLLNAIYECKPDIVKLLLEAGANLLSEDDCGNAPENVLRDDRIIFNIYRNANNDSFCSRIFDDISTVNILREVIKAPNSDKRLSAYTSSTREKLLAGDIDTIRAYLKDGGRQEYFIRELLTNGQVHTINRFIDAGLELKWDTKYSDDTAFELAIGSGNEELIRLLIASGIDLPNISKEYCKKLLEAVADSGSTKILHLLIDVGFPWKDVDENGEHVLLSDSFWYSMHDNVVFAQEILKLGIDKNDQLLKAVEYGKEEILRWLLSEGANIQMVDDDRNTLLHLFFSYDKYPNIKKLETFLSCGIDINLVNNYGETALSRAVECCHNSEHLEIIKYLLQHGADPNAPSSPIILNAIFKENINIDLVRILLDAGADVNIIDEYGCSPLIEAKLSGGSEIANILEKYGVVEPENVKTDLYTAIYWNNTEQASKLIKSGYDIEAHNQIGETALISAIRTWCNIDIINELIRHNANLDTYYYDDFPYNPLNWAVGSVDINVIKLLLESGAIPDSSTLLFAFPYHPSYYAAAQTNRDRYQSEIVKLILNYGVSPNTTSEFHGTPLHQAAIKNNIELTSLLIDYGAEIDILANFDDMHNEGDKLTPLGAALICKCYDTATLLIDRGADINISNINNKTPLMALLWHIPADEENAYAILQKLINNGADVNAVDNEGTRVLQYAHPPKIREILLKAGAR